MSADWFVSRAALQCGRCHARLPAGSPMRRLRTGGLRCAPCATALLGEAVPTDLAPPPAPERPAPPPGPPPLQPFVERVKRWFDAKRRASGDDAA